MYLIEVPVEAGGRLVVQVSPDATTLLASAADDRTVRLWNPAIRRLPADVPIPR